MPVTIDRSALDRDGQLPAPVRRRDGRSGTMAEAMAMIPDRSRVYVSALMGTPTALVDAMADEPDRWTGIETASDYLLEPLATFGSGNPFRHLSVQPSRATAGLPADRIRIVPARSSQFFRLFTTGGPLAVDVVLVQVSEPGPDGRFSLGVLGGAAVELVRTAPLVIAEVNPAMPYVRGPVACDRHEFDLLVDVEAHDLVCLPPAAAPTSPAAQPDPVSAAIAEGVARLVTDRATIEYGIGALPDTALAALAQHRRLGLHSGMLGDAAIDLIERGVLDGSAKTIDAGLHVTSALVGTGEAVRWLHDRDDVVVVASNYSHGIPALAAQDRFTAINSAVEVALDGAVNAESVAGRVVSGPGGQPDFANAAWLSQGGRNIVVLPSTARSGAVSRIVAAIEPPAPVTVSRYLADCVVTEIGVAELAGVDLVDRVRRLVGVAHPDHRFALESVMTAREGP